MWMSVLARDAVHVVVRRDRFGRGEREATRLNPADADQSVGDFADDARPTAQEHNLETTGRVEMHVRRRDDVIQMRVLQLGEPLGEPACVMVVNQSHDADGETVVARDGLFNERGAHQPAHRFAAVRVPMRRSIPIELPQQLAADRHAESDSHDSFDHKSGVTNNQCRSRRSRVHSVRARLKKILQSGRGGPLLSG